MSLGAMVAALEALPRLRARLEGKRSHVSLGSVLSVHWALANAYRDERGYVDETVEQLSAVTGYSQSAVSRALGALATAGAWKVEAHGGPQRGSRRVPGFPLGTHRPIGNGVTPTHVPMGTVVEDPLTAPSGVELAEEEQLTAPSGAQSESNSPPYSPPVAPELTAPWGRTPLTPDISPPTSLEVTRATQPPPSGVGASGRGGVAPQPSDRFRRTVVVPPGALEALMESAVERLTRTREANGYGPAHEGAKAKLLAQAATHRPALVDWLDRGAHETEMASALAARLSGDTHAAPASLRGQPRATDCPLCHVDLQGRSECLCAVQPPECGLLR